MTVPGANLVADIAALPKQWHGAGTVSDRVLTALARYHPAFSVETGTGRTTLLFSHLSGRHIVFTKEDAGDGDSLDAVRTSPLLGECEFVVGPTQQTLLSYSFDEPIDLAYLDGPHAYPFPDLEYWAVYPHIPEGGVLVIDDVNIPTIGNLFAFLKADAMWSLEQVVDNTAFFHRTATDAVDPYGEGWWLQAYNQHRSLRHLTPTTFAQAVGRRLGRIFGQ